MKRYQALYNWGNLFFRGMASVWMLSKQSMKGMDVLNLTTDLLYTLELHRKGEPMDETEFAERLGRGADLVSRLTSSVDAQLTRQGPRDFFMMRISERVEKKLGLRPSEFNERLGEGAEELRQAKPSQKTVELLEAISEAAAQFTVRSVEGLSTSLL